MVDNSMEQMDLEESVLDEFGRLKVLAKALNPHTPTKTSKVNPQYDTLYGMVRRGRLLEDDEGVANLKTELIYKIFKLDPEKSMGDDDDGPYTRGKIPLEGDEFPTKDLFGLFPEEVKVRTREQVEVIMTPAKINRFQKEGSIAKKIQQGEIREVNLEEYVQDAPRKIVEDLLGSETFEYFNLAHKIHRSTGKKRAGTNFYFAHPFRVAFKVKEMCEYFGKSEEYTRTAVVVALLHDLVEEMQSFREGKREDLSKLITGARESRRYGRRITDLNEKIANPPELGFGPDSIRPVFKDEPELEERTVQLLQGISHHGDEDYDEYIIRMYLDIQKNQQNGSEFGLSKFYDILPLVKMRDAIDNTETLTGIGMDRELERLTRNLTLAEETYNFLRERGITRTENDMLIECLEELLVKSSEFAEESWKTYLDASKDRQKKEDYVLRGDAVSFKDISEHFLQTREKLQSLYDEFRTAYAEESLRLNPI